MAAEEPNLMPPSPRPDGSRGVLPEPVVTGFPSEPQPGRAFDPVKATPRYLLASLLFALTLFTTTTLGSTWYLWTRTDLTTDLFPLLLLSIVRQVWTSPVLLGHGLSFSLPLLFILLCHELGHYLLCRRYRLPATLPYFIPAPFGIGTLGAFIRIRGRIQTKRELMDVGIAGPIAGFVALLPFLAYGIAHSHPAPLLLAQRPEEAQATLLVPGKSLAMIGMTRLFHGPLDANVVLDLHPFALAAWFGLLATALNLLPLSQLDGGHILYSVTGAWQRRLAVPLWVGLAVAGVFWRGWFLWCVIALALGLRHPPVGDEREPLDPLRRRLGLLALALFVVSFMPVPLDIVEVLHPS